jgi:hypothetical protein
MGFEQPDIKKKEKRVGNPIGLGIHKMHVHVYVHVFISKHQWCTINKRKRIGK